MSRNESPSGDLVTLFTEHRSSYFDLNSTSNFGFSPMRLDTIIYQIPEQNFLSMASGEIDQTQSLIYLPTSWELSGTRIVQSFLQYPGTLSDLDSTGNYASPIYSPDGCIGWPHRYSEDLGRIFWQVNVGYTNTITLFADHEMVCYTKLSDSLPCPANALLTNSETKIIPEPTIWYHSIDQNGGQLHWENLKQGQYEIKLTDIHGQVLMKEQVALAENGTQSLSKFGSSGIYFFSLTSLKTGNCRVLKIAHIQ